MISERLAAARTRLGWSREALAYHSGISWSAIAQLESGRRTSPRPETLVSLARALGVTVGYLVGEHPPTALLSHRAVLYDSPEGLADAVAPFVLEGVERSEPVLVVTTQENHSSVERQLGGWPPTVATGESQEWYLSPLSAVTALRSFQQERNAEGALWMRFVGEPIWHPPDISKWATYESMFNLIFAASPFTVMCPYDSTSLDPAVLQVARETHPSLVQGGQVETNERFIDPETYVLGEEPPSGAASP
jgi:transcriptional regulator with XRE-family HTH domain